MLFMLLFAKKLGIIKTSYFCGTVSFEPVKNAQDKKIDVIVLDHDQSDLKLPKACAIVNPNRFDDTSKLNYLCAAGVCFMFLIALSKKLRDKNWFKNNDVQETSSITEAWLKDNL